MLYGSNDYPYQDEIDTRINADCHNPPDLVMVMGTSLRVNAATELIRNLAVRASKVIFVNKEAPRSATAGLFTHHVQGRTDDWAELILGQLKDVTPTQSTGATFDQPCLKSADQTGAGK